MFLGRRLNKIYNIPLIKALLILALFLLVNHSYTRAQGTTGAVSLKQSLGARGMGMGEAFTGVSDDISAIWYNPAGIANIHKRQIGAMYLLGLEDSRFGFIGYVQSFSKKGRMGIGIHTFQAGKMVIDDIDEESGKKVSAQDDYLVSVSYALPLFTRLAEIKRKRAREFIRKKKAISSQLLFGASFKGLSSTLIEKYKATAYCGDFGLHWSFLMKRMALGIVVQNLGSKIKYVEEGDPLPLTVRGGIASRFAFGRNHKITSAFDILKEKDKSVQENLGVEYIYKEMLALRLGYKFGYDLDSLTAGVGFTIKGYQLDYGYGIMGDLDSIHRISFMYSF